MIRLSSNADTIQGLLDDIAMEISYRAQRLIESMSNGHMEPKSAHAAATALTILATDIKTMEYGPVAASERVSKPMTDREVWRLANPDAAKTTPC